MIDLTTLGYYVGFPFGKPVIRFYAICILVGACFALFLSNYRAHKDGYDWHFFDTVFPLAFLSGIIGARIWYVIASWDEFSGGSIWHIFDMRSGGLAIQGGAIGGVLVGVIYCLLRRKGTSILKITDFAVPTIIIAQAIGRWGNFFNQEVFGHFVSADSWNFLPSFITNNMQNGNLPMGAYMYNGEVIRSASTGITVPSGAVASPLFLVEGVVNILFYFIITKGLPAVLGKRYRNGDQTYAYFVSYGIIRMILEPLRNPAFIMGSDTVDSAKSGYKSYGMAIAFIAIGVALIVINHICHYLAEKGKMDKIPAFRSIFIEGENASTLMMEKNTVIEDEKQEDSFSDDIDMSLLKKKENELSSEDKKEDEHE